MKVKCTKCGVEIEKTIESARSHVRHKHPNLSDKAKIRLRDSICAFVPSGGFGKGRNKYENFLTKLSGIK